LNECISSILLSRGVDELLLVDNASTDGSMELAEKNTDARLKIIRLKRNIGLAKARNLAAAKAVGNYLAFTDADTKVDREWLQELCILLETHKAIGAVQCKILSYKHPNKTSYAGVGLNDWNWKDMPKGRLNSYRRILFPIGAAFIIRREIWDLVKGFDPAFFVGNDDVDLGIRLWLSGYEVICSHRAIAYHDGGDLRSRKDVAPIFQFYGIKNMLSIWTKDLQGRTLVKEILPFSLLYPFMAFWEAGVPGVMGMLSFLKELLLILIKRNEVQQLRRTSDEKIMPMLQLILPIHLLTDDLRTLLKYIFRRIRTFMRNIRNSIARAPIARARGLLSGKIY
jgi:GT2 family glycosyltransferase